MDVQFVYGRLDLQKLDGIDATVCPTDVYCSGSGGLDQKIHQAAGPLLKFALKDSGLSEGDVCVTGAFNLDTRYEIPPSAAHLFCFFSHCPSGDLRKAISECMKEKGAALTISFLRKYGAEPCRGDSV
ncbi:MAG: hypothetical protein J6V25_02700 [Oscillospiraceae bacterium]|nr:hypothetical protein [Oscillospiraceae bacterium]